LATELKSPVVLRDMTRNDLEGALELSREQAWPYRPEDWDLFLEMGEGLVATLDDRIVGTILAWRFGNDYATIGAVIVTNRIQKMGIGRQLMQAMLDRLEGRNVVLNATAEGLPLYQKLGFVAYGEVRQHQGPAPIMPLAELRPGERVRPIGGSAAEVTAMWSRASGMDRSAMFKPLAKGNKCVVLTRDHEPVGFALLRRFGRGSAIAPIVAPDLDGAKALICHWLNARAGKFCRIDVVEGLGLSKWLEAEGLPCISTVTTMVRGKAPQPDDGPRVFAVAAQALG
jgi:GNAT superfamily N-acetyltransferase